ncbi:4Fe-4S ferredoxin [Rhodospirillum rubrum]|uniref:FAD-binding and (Fe-S)-binding domain-containing protein n=1 Tax=Rhodospirillum rubrum TaxID=1085 RepID=UPI00190541FA|nr:FAD-binding and (Fe-S)-binding domain-containing protein [Rhodospirillum rubrum]MBK1662917.1 4Fe-4S ferredoxin [Rhodospirillum rubrum]MBK1675204.1 4Fe-4S ferredoxin [Rhodospirillum rubrum]
MTDHPASSIDYSAVLAALRALLPGERIFTDPLRLLAYGTDASFYRLLPKVVVEVADEAEVARVLAICRQYRAPVTFRAAGTSLSGQAVSESVLMVLGRGWTGTVIEANGARIRLQPGVIGAEANRKLAGFGRKIGPDPASIDTCKIGGIAANNASGMCCGTSDNSYQTVEAMRLILADGTLVDTADARSIARFRQTHADLLAGLAALGQRVRANAALAARIRRKYAIKNTTGYSLNALVDYDDPLDILTHLLIGSEGTLGFIAEITYRTIAEHPAKASALLLFADIAEACRAVTLLKATPVSAVELMDRAALRSVEDKPGMPAQIRGLAPGVAALLVETRAADSLALQATIEEIGQTLGAVTPLFPPAFSSDPAVYGTLWKIRKGLFPAVGAVRATGTTVIIEDVAFPIEHLAAATVTLERLCHEHGYHEAILFGHALDGNLHFVFTQDFGSQAEIDRYAAFMDAVGEMVVKTYDGSLKAEHGTGRNMAPFVEMEWGSEAYGLMGEIKALLDPLGLLNPGVILNGDPRAHLKNLKPLPAADALIDKCIECGFCEPLCPSLFLTLSPRQRITAWREIARLESTGASADKAALRDLYDYQGVDTCAACGLCGTVCPVGINTGALTTQIRGTRRGPTGRRIGRWLGRHFATTSALARLGLGSAALIGRAIGEGRLESASATLRRLTGNRLPRWHRAMPKATPTPPPLETANNGQKPRVVYFPGCAGRAMGQATNDPTALPLPARTEALLRRAGFEVIYPEGLDNLCCGVPFESAGLADVAATKTAEVAAALRIASAEGTIPIISDTSPCSLRLKQHLEERLRPQDAVEFLHDHVLGHLPLRPTPGPVAIHITCSTQRMGLGAKMEALAAACAETVIRPPGIPCCGFAGDRGFVQPELNAHALRGLKASLPEACREGYSSNRTCEIGLSQQAGFPYRSIIDLVASRVEAADRQDQETTTTEQD